VVLQGLKFVVTHAIRIWF